MTPTTSCYWTPVSDTSCLMFHVNFPQLQCSFNCCMYTNIDIRHLTTCVSVIQINTNTLLLSCRRNKLRDFPCAKPRVRNTCPSSVWPSCCQMRCPQLCSPVVTVDVSNDHQMYYLNISKYLQFLTSNNNHSFQTLLQYCTALTGTYRREKHKSDLLNLWL